jgi:glycosyltransferase involved in cell wall biosynthesis
MKVLYLIPQPKRPERIGAYTFLDEEIQALAAAGIQAFVLSTQVKSDTWCGQVRLKAARMKMTKRSDVVKFLSRQAGRVPPGNLLSPKLLYHAGRLECLASRMAVQEDVDLIHSHFAWPEGFGGILTKARTGRPLVASLRGTDVLMDPVMGYGRRREASYARAIQRLLRTADRTICFSEFMRDHVVSLGADRQRSRVVRKGVDLSLFAPAADRQSLKAELGLPAGPLILSVGGLIARKGVHVTLEALGRVKLEHPFTFVVCGDGPELERLEALAHSQGIADRTRFAGVVERTTIARYFAACDLLVHAPLLEAAGNVLFEAMASGRPVLCTRAGGPEEYITDGRTGYVVPPGDAHQLAARISSLLADPAAADRLGAEGLKQSHSAFAFDRMTRDIIAVYEEALAAGRSKAS